jgi:hypothetical protein
MAVESENKELAKDRDITFLNTLGFTQPANGPCGVLACAQAYFLRYYFFPRVRLIFVFPSFLLLSLLF